MDPIYPTPLQTDLRDEVLWPTSSHLPSYWSQPAILSHHPNAPTSYPVQQQDYSHIEPHQVMESYANVYTPGASPLLSAHTSPYMPPLYPAKALHVPAERTYYSAPPSTGVRQSSFPTPDPSPHLTPSPKILPQTEQVGSINSLMKEIQLRSREPEEQEFISQSSTIIYPAFSHGGRPTTSTPKEKKHVCSQPDCGKTFSQKTHLDIHLRSHSGLKPFACPYPPCPSRFTQLGNLKTHVRRHTGEKPFSCDLCPKRFAQRGNVRSHRATVHTSREEKTMFECRLDGCGKFFSQRGNLKGHMERFHQDAINELKMKFSNIDGDVQGELSDEERDLWDYLREMYKHSNKGIKGRGKDRKVLTLEQQQQQQQEESAQTSPMSSTASSYHSQHDGSPEVNGGLSRSPHSSFLFSSR